MNEHKPELKIIALGGTESVTKNLTVYECGDDMIVVDCGVGFPDSEMLGVDLVVPDLTYVKENSHKLRGIFITHGHEDHIGALQYLLRDISATIYCAELVQGFISERLKEKQNKIAQQNASFKTLSPESAPAQAGCFKVEAFRVNHSVPRSQGLAIHTPQGTVLHMADYKIDWTPVLDKPIDMGKIASYGEAGVLCLLSDCLGATTEGYSKSESSLNNTFSDLFEEYEGRQIFITTISSNLSRMYQIITAAQKYGRKVVLSGRSIDQSMRVITTLGYISFDEGVFVADKDASDYDQSQLVYIIAGCYGQEGSSLDRVARKDHDFIEMRSDAVVIFSADPSPPSVREGVERLIDTLILNGAEVIYGAIQENLHVSGHGVKGDLTIVAGIVHPRYFIPIGGTVAKMRAYTNMVKSLGFDSSSVFELLEGQSAVFSDVEAKKGPTVETKPMLVGSNHGGAIHEAVVKDRQRLSDDGVFVLLFVIDKETKKLSKRPEVVTRGFVFVKESKVLMDKSSAIAEKLYEKHSEKNEDWGFMRNRLERDMADFLKKETGVSPMVIAFPIVLS